MGVLCCHFRPKMFSHGDHVRYHSRTLGAHVLATIVGPSPNGPQFCHIRYIRPGGVTPVDHESAQLSRLEAVAVESPKSPKSPDVTPMSPQPQTPAQPTQPTIQSVLFSYPEDLYRSFGSSITFVLDETHWHRINAKVASHVFSLLASVEGTTVCLEIPLQSPPPPGRPSLGDRLPPPPGRPSRATPGLCKGGGGYPEILYRSFGPPITSVLRESYWQSINAQVTSLVLCLLASVEGTKVCLEIPLQSPPPQGGDRRALGGGDFKGGPG